MRWRRPMALCNQAGNAGGPPVMDMRRLKIQCLGSTRKRQSGMGRQPLFPVVALALAL